jgi:hypothetical protein
MLQMSPPPANVELKDLQNAEKTLEEFGGIFKQAANVHLHTRKLGKACKDIFFKLDNQFQLSKNSLTLAQVEAEILKFSNNHPVVKRVLASIKLPRAKLDGETGLNIPDLLIKTWHLASDAYGYDGARDLVIDNLKHNVATGGGCLPGIAARLVHPYSVLIFNKLQTQRMEAFLGTPAQAAQIDAPAAAATSSARNEEAELALAIKESLLISAPSAVKEEKKTIRNTLPVAVIEAQTAEEDNDDMNLAKALSLSLSQK